MDSDGVKRGGGNPQAKHESGAVAREESLKFQQRPDGSQIAVRPDGTQMRILTGDRTTGKLHLGHWVGSLKNRVRLQHIYDTFILMADVQALTTHYDRPEILRQSVWDVALDYLAAGIDPEKATIVVQSMVPSIADLTVYYGLLVPVRSLIDNPTTKAEAEAYGYGLELNESIQYTWAEREGSRKVIGHLIQRFPEIGEVSDDVALRGIKAWFGEDFRQRFARSSHGPPANIPIPTLTEMSEMAINTPHQSSVRDAIIIEKRKRGFSSITYGFLGYPISQAADITFVDADLVPVGVDQVPLIELCREVVHRFNNQYGAGQEILRTPQALLGSTELIRGIDGSAKMSKSQNNAIYLSDSDEQIWDLLRPAPTDPQRVRKTDPGRPEMCNIFAYHTTFCGAKEAGIDEQAIGAASVEEVAYNCSHAQWGCIDCKKNLAIKLKALLDPMRERRAHWDARRVDVADILKRGTQRGREEGEKTLQRVRDAMHMDYFTGVGSAGEGSAAITGRDNGQSGNAAGTEARPPSVPTEQRQHPPIPAPEGSGADPLTEGKLGRE